MVAIESSDSNEEAPVDTGRHKAHAIKRTAAETLRMMMRIGLGVDVMEPHRNEMFLSLPLLRLLPILFSLRLWLQWSFVLGFGVMRYSHAKEQGGGKK